MTNLSHKFALLTERFGIEASGYAVRLALGAVAIKVSAILLSLVVAVVLARVLGPEQYGIYSYVIAIVTVTTIPVQFGLPNLVVRETAKAQVAEEWKALRALWRGTSLIVAFVSAGILLIGGVLLLLLEDHFSTGSRLTMAFGLLLIPIFALGNLRGAALRGLQRVLLGQLPELILRPGLLVLFLIGVLLLLPKIELNSVSAMVSNVIAASMAFVIGAGMLRWFSPKEVGQEAIGQYRWKFWILASAPLAMVAALQVVNKYLDILVLGIFREAAEVGIYRVAAQIGIVTGFGLTAIMMVFAPNFARLHAKNDKKKLHRFAVISSRAGMAVAFPVFLVILVFARPLLSKVLGPEYAVAYVPVVILSFTYLINSSFGAVGALLNMTGYEKDTARGVAIALVANLTLNLMLIPLFGMLGAALATLVSFILWNSILVVYVRRRLNFNPLF